MVDDVIVRPLCHDDHGQVLALAPELLTGMPDWRPRAGQIKAVTSWIQECINSEMDDSRGNFVAVVDGVSVDDTSGRSTVVGFIGVKSRHHFSGQPEAYVGELVVAADHRRQGIAKALMQKAEDWATHRGLARISLETGAANERALIAYAALGFEVESVSLTKAISV